MDELVNLVAQKTGLPPDQARLAAETVLGFLKERLPEPLAGQIDAALSGGQNPLGGLGGMLGR